MTDEQEELEQERDFLMQSLDDLEAEHDSGGIDDESYQQLHDDYTARAAATIRALRDGVDARPDPAPRAAPRRRLVIISLVVVFALIAGVALAGALGARLPGQTASGNTQSSSDDAASKRLARTIKTLEAAVNANPDDYNARLALAHAYEAVGDIRNALAQSDAAISIDPNRAEAHANAGRLLYIASQSIKNNDTQVQFVTEASAAFNTAIEKDPEYSETYFFRAVLEFATAQLDRAQADLQTYLVKSPNGPYAENARDLLARITKALEATSTTVPNSS
jgi:cytochrome c-type biogenesis protein CcmH/NrfG